MNNLPDRDVARVLPFSDLAVQTLFVNLLGEAVGLAKGCKDQEVQEEGAHKNLEEGEDEEHVRRYDHSPGLLEYIIHHLPSQANFGAVTSPVVVGPAH